MLINWHEKMQQIELPNRKNELWRYSQLSDFINVESKTQNSLAQITSLPEICGNDVIVFNGLEWQSTSPHVVIKTSTIEENNLAAQDSSLVKQDGLYAWYKDKSSSSVEVTVTGCKKIALHITIGTEQSLVPEIKIDLSQIQGEFTIFEIQTSATPNNATSLYSIQVVNKKSSLNYHRLNLEHHHKSISWLNIVNSHLVHSYIWKQKDCQNKEFISINNIKESAEANLRLIANLNGNAKYDLTTLINHQTPKTNSFQQFKCILDDKARAALTGKIFISKNCPETKAYFKSKQTLLSSQSHIFSQPQLEILTDDVECAHGSSTGSLQEEEVFYLNSRGISPSKAKKMLLAAFINDEILTFTCPKEQTFFQGLIL